MASSPSATDLEWRETIEYVAVRRVQTCYADIVTRRAWAELPTIMTDDCEVIVDTLGRSYHFGGPKEIGDFIGRQIDRFSFFEFVVLNTVIHIDHKRGPAGARMYLQELRQDGATTGASPGPIDSSELGRTLMHEHLVIGYPGWESATLALPISAAILSSRSKWLKQQGSTSSAQPAFTEASKAATPTGSSEPNTKTLSAR